jgi:hypothetical protein
MAEPYGQPTKEYLEKARELYSDPLLCWATNTAIKCLPMLQGQKYSEVSKRDVYRKLRLIILNEGYSVALEILFQAGEDVANETWSNFEITPEEPIKSNYKIDPTASELKDKLPIIAVAEKYGLVVDGKKCVCPFHEDKDPSLNFYPETNSFFCFGCRTGGDLIKFVQLMEGLKNDTD